MEAKQEKQVGPGFVSRTATSAKAMIAKHKKSCLVVVGLLVLAIVLLFVWAHTCPDGFVGKVMPVLPWTSPDYKLLGKNHTNKTRRSDNKVDTWSKDDFLKSVAKFNNIAMAVE